ncbi:cryptic tubulin [Nannochloropsis gaditana]|uniref:Tubulin delta chain n=4 Tax=Nannochloropsis gaditana TaxID=72520 RepID=W7T5S1_9STRA|nr:cryptic tubulin [Nannochloropsis gaditana]
MVSATLHVHIGQCGNQIGEQFWSLAADDFAAAADNGDASSFSPQYPHPLFHEQDGRAAAVFVDSEAKVVDRLRKNSRLASVLRKEACITDSSGRANNWAMGFTSSCKELAQSRGLFYSTVNVLRRELERIDSLQSLVIYHSLAGGTGSGVGSALFQYLREACPSVNITTCSVGPFSTGDCATQWYNSTFTLNALSEHADTVLYRDNDQLLGEYLRVAGAAEGTGRRGMSGGRGLALATSKASMGRLNESLAADLACLLFPTVTSPSIPTCGGGGYRAWDALALQHDCTPFKYAKFVDNRSSWSTSTATTLPTSSVSFKAAAGHGLHHLPDGRLGGAGGGQWADECVYLGKDVIASFPTEDGRGKANVTLAAQMTVRGVDLPGTGPHVPGQEQVSLSEHPRGKGGPQKSGQCRDSNRNHQKPQTSNPYLPPTPWHPGLTAFLHHDLPRALRLPSWRQGSPIGTVFSSHSQPSILPCTSMPAARPFSSSSPGVAICANRTHMSSTVEKVLGRAEEMAEHRAYLHWFHRHGIEDDDFTAAFEGLRRVKEEYDELGSGSDRALRDMSGRRRIRDYR